VSRPKLLVVDDDASSRFVLRECFEQRGYDVDEALTCEAAVALFRSARPDVAILDYSLPDGTALELLPRLKALDASVPLLLLTGHGTIDLAVQAIKDGAEHFLTKPVELSAVVVVVERSLENLRNRKRQIAVRSREVLGPLDPFRGTSPAIRRLAEEARRIARAETPVLIQGETGAGKGVLASWLHRNGPRAEEPFVDLNCASLSKDLFESELFGHERGAFTGAVAVKQGLLEVAHRGTVFLDEIGDMDLSVQPKLLKVLEDKRFRRLGDVRDRLVDVRLVVASHQDLMHLVNVKTFRSDLYFRISAIPLLVPALRERVEDIPLLAEDLVTRIAAEMGRADVHLSEDARLALTLYGWPGNVRELRNVLERAVLLCEGRQVERADLRFAAALREPDASDADSALTLEQVERRHIERILKEEHWRIDPAAKRLNVPRSTLYRRIKALAIEFPRSDA
jgi:DNA-binding NtrC family response regulator